MNQIVEDKPCSINSQHPEVLSRIQKLLIQLRNEMSIFERLLYKNTNQHRRCLYFRRLRQVRRDLRLLQSARLSEVIESPLLQLPSNKPKASEDVTCLRKRLLGIARLLDQMMEPILYASSQIAALLSRTFFMPFALTTIASLARFRVLLQQLLYDVVHIFNELSLYQNEEMLRLQQLCQTSEFNAKEIGTKSEKCEELPCFLECQWDAIKSSLFERMSKQTLCPPRVNADDSTMAKHDILDNLNEGFVLSVDMKKDGPFNKGHATCIEDCSPFVTCANSRVFVQEIFPPVISIKTCDILKEKQTYSGFTPHINGKEFEQELFLPLPHVNKADISKGKEIQTTKHEEKQSMPRPKNQENHNGKISNGPISVCKDPEPVEKISKELVSKGYRREAMHAELKKKVAYVSVDVKTAVSTDCQKGKTEVTECPGWIAAESRDSRNTSNPERKNADTLFDMLMGIGRDTPTAIL
eukprot:c24807_g1_i1 orf=92-1498(+)